MRLQFSSLVIFLLPCVGRAQAVHMNIWINGSQVGANTYSQAPDGSFTSKTSLHIGNISLDSTVKGKIDKGKLSTVECESNSPGGLLRLSYSGGKLSMTPPKGASKTVPYPQDAPLAGNLHPQFWAYSLKAVEAKTSIEGGQVTLNALLVDAGAVIPIKYTKLSQRDLTVAGKARSVDRFDVDIAGISGELDMDDSGEVVGFDVPVQHLRFLADGWDGLYADPLAKFPELSQATYKFRTESGVKMATRDGVELACDVVHPDDAEKHPVILIRTPYGRATETVNAGFYASRGYVVVTQDCRGREDSEGDWDPFVHEGDDGYDAIEWCAKQPWSNGNIGMIGGSYDGYVQWAAAVKDPPHLKCIVPQVSPPDAMRNIPYDHGIFALYLDLWWAKIVAGKHTDFSTLRSSLPHPMGLTTLPLSKADDAVLGQKLEFYQKWLNRPTIKDWSGWDFTYHLDQVTIPVLHISGTWDGDEIGTHINWNTMRGLGRKNEWIVFGPWTHAFNTTHSIGDVEYGTDAITDLDSLYVRWFDTWLKGKSVGMDQVPHVRLFVTGANKWVSLDDWPSSQMSPRTLYLQGRALKPNAGSDDKLDYTYDPAKNTIIPAILLDMDPSKGTTKVAKGDFDPKSTFLISSAAFDRKTAIASPVTVDLYFKTSARDTDLYAQLLDISPDGSMHAICNAGKIRGSYLSGLDQIVPLEPGKVYKAEITPWDFAHEFEPGHKLGLAILATGFPIFSRNLGTADAIATGTKTLVQNNTILEGAGHPSKVSFYVLWDK